MVSRREIRTSHSVHFINRDLPRESRVTCEQLQLADSGKMQPRVRQRFLVFSLTGRSSGSGSRPAVKLKHNVNF